jgi:hypothetical protein
MTLDEDLRRRFEALADQIRAETARQLGEAAGELSTKAEAERADAVTHAANDARVEAEKQAAARLAEAVAAAESRARQEGHDRGRDEGVAQGREEGRQEGRQAGHAEGKQEGREEGREEGRREGHDDARREARSTELALNERLADAIRAMDRAGSLSEILDALASCASRETRRAAVLIVRGGQLQGWKFVGFGSELADARTVQLPVAEAGIIADAVRTVATVSAESGRGAAPPFANLPPGREMVAVPLSVSGQVVAVLYADQGSGSSEDRPAEGDGRFAWPAIVEVMARHASRSVEAVTAFRTAQVFTGRPGGSASTEETMAGADGKSGGAASRAGEEDEAARRYARLLVSEIKLYHEAEVIAGRRDRDLATRLGGEIARARVLYEQRVPAHVRSTTDHFHAELVQTLANGDPTLLGQTASGT